MHTADKRQRGRCMPPAWPSLQHEPASTDTPTRSGGGAGFGGLVKNAKFAAKSSARQKEKPHINQRITAKKVRGELCGEFFTSVKPA